MIGNTVKKKGEYKCREIKALGTPQKPLRGMKYNFVTKSSN